MLNLTAYTNNIITFFNSMPVRYTIYYYNLLYIYIACQRFYIIRFAHTIRKQPYYNL